MESKTRTVTILLAVCAVFAVAAVIAQRAGSTHPPVLITVLTAVAAALAAAGAYGLNSGTSWSWPTALGAGVLTALLSVGAIINAPVGAKVGAAVILVVSLVSVALLMPLRRSGRAAHS
ncbi:MAG: hypothetical protein NVS3B26_28820 [Mycobacteriales bacterium]